MHLVLVNLIIIVTSLFCVTDPIPLSALGLVQIVVCCWTIYKHSPIKLPLGLFFLALIYFLHSGFGLLLLQGYSFNEIEPRHIYTLKEYGYAQVFTELSIFLFTMGYISKVRKKIAPKIKEIGDIQGKYYVAFFLLCFPLYVASILMTVNIAKNYGYVDTYRMTSSSPLFHYGSILINSCIPMVTLLFVIYKKNVVMCRNLAVIMLIISVYSMVSGQRIIAITGIISLGVIYYNVVSEINKKTLIIISLFAVFLVVFLPMVTALRTYGNVDVEHMTETYNEMKTVDEEGFLYSFIHEFGNTVISLVIPIIRTGESDTYSFGLTYLLAPLSLSPKLPVALIESDFYRDAMFFITKYPEARFINFGGSILGEAFANFGWLGFLVLYFVGLLIKQIDNSIYMARTGQVSYYSLLLIFVIPNLLRWTRDAISCVIGFIFIALYFLWLFSLNKKQTNKKIYFRTTLNW